MHSKRRSPSSVWACHASCIELQARSPFQQSFSLYAFFIAGNCVQEHLDQFRAASARGAVQPDDPAHRYPQRRRVRTGCRPSAAAAFRQGRIGSGRRLVLVVREAVVLILFFAISLARQRPPDDEHEQHKRKDALEDQPRHMVRDRKWRRAALLYSRDLTLKITECMKKKGWRAPRACSHCLPAVAQV